MQRHLEAIVLTALEEYKFRSEVGVMLLKKIKILMAHGEGGLDNSGVLLQFHITSIYLLEAFICSF